MTTVNITVTKSCAFCKYWYDPSNEMIEPKDPKHNLWAHQDNCKRKCLKRNLEVSTLGYCENYCCKLPVT